MEKVKKYCFIFLLVLLFVPILQRFIKFHITTPLQNTPISKNYPVFHYKTWSSGEYQLLAEKFVNDNFGYRNSLLRITNSIDFFIFKTSNSKEVVIGKDNYLFFDYNIKRYLGIDRQDHKQIDSLFVQTDIMRDKLKARNIELVFVIVPSNAFYFSDKFPVQYDSYKKRENDYDYYLKKLNEYNISYVDFNKWFMDIKDTVSVDLFPKNGTHYTYFSAVWVGDSLVKYMEKLRNIDMPELVVESVKLDSMKSYEHDLENVMNLANDLKNEDLYYHKLKSNEIGKTKPKVLTVGDSFYWPIMNQMIPAYCFSNVAYWFYNTDVYPESFKNKMTPDQVDLDSLYKDLDFILIYSSATLIKNYDYNGFIGDMMFYLDGKYEKKKESDKLKYWVQAIKNNPDWLNTITQKAADLNIPLEEQLIIEATWLIEQEKLKKP
jgi:hypothetical protein